MNGMRITNNTAMRRYVNNLQSNFFKKNQAENKIIANRKFTRASQSPLEAAKALKVRKAISETETYQKNLETARGIYDVAEGAIMQVSSIMQTLQEKLVAGAHGTFVTNPDKQIIAQEIESMAHQMVKLMNLVAADRRIFGGVSNSDLQPYEIRDGVVLFNGVPVNEHNDPSLFPFAQTSFLDAGLGLSWLDDYTIDPQSAIPVTFNGAALLGSGMTTRPASTLMTTALDINVTSAGVTALPAPPATATSWTFDANVGGTVTPIRVRLDSATDPSNPRYVLDPPVRGVALADADVSAGTFSLYTTNSSVSLSSAVAAGTRTFVTEIPQGDFPVNIIQLTLDAARAVRTGNHYAVSPYLDLMYESGSFLSLSIADIGSTQKFIEFNQERLRNNMLSLMERENLLEYPDMGEEITKQKVLEMIYNATLQMSAQTIPMSIFNFMR
jgi:flagellin-like hook-associated protein FlgL